MDNSEIIQESNVINEKPSDNPDVIEEAVTSSKTKEPTTVVTAGQEQQQQQQAVARTRSSREEKMRKKDDKSVDHVLKALNSLNTTEEKLAAMCKKYADIFDENRKLQLALKQAEKRCSTLQREKEQLQTEHSKAILTRSRLENLCRELQRQNKAIKDESLLKIREEEEKRKEVSAKFQATLNEITTLMQQNNDKNMKLRDDNIDMNAKLKNVCEQYELREQQVEKISKQMQLEAQLADAKLAKAQVEMAAEREIMLREKQQILMELSQYQTRCQEFQATEINLRSQISMYDDKYDEFQKALARSNEVFGGFKGEMEKMSKKMCKLEKEVSTWKQRWEGSHRALLEMAEEKQKADQELNHANRQVLTLQRLCRTLQGERSSLLAKLKDYSQSDDKIGDNMNKIESTDDSTIANEKLLESDVQQLINGDILENKCEIKSVSSKTKSAGKCANSPKSSKTTKPVHDSKSQANSEIFVQSSCQSTSLPIVSDNSSQVNEQNNSFNEITVNNCNNNVINESVVNNDATSLNNIITNDEATLPASLTADVITPVVTTNIEEPSSNSSTVENTDPSINLIQHQIVTPESSKGPDVTTPDSLIQKPLTESAPNSDVTIATENPSEVNISTIDETSDVNNKAAENLKSSVVVLPPVSNEDVNKQHSILNSDNVIKSDAINSVSNPTELKQKSNVEKGADEQPIIKKQSNENNKRGKESRKKKKNA
ncbi:uncharacterized protein LOC142327761 [Lycorma delicatula]|uniref:uncharacterized protein LOC142327761 n=1 Tax=Lycorma delicatula TaxID=130591 RepID=UPI003F517696